jgi:RNA polymerase sigma-70 factor (ECF subfamily)
MSASPGSLLQRLQQSGDRAAWERLVDLYSGHLFLWACRAGLPGEQAGELMRKVFADVAARLPECRGGFRAWLRDLAHARRRELLLQKVPAGAGPVDLPATPLAADALWEEEYLPSLLGPALDLVQGEFPAREWQACWGVVVEGRLADDVARELGITPADVQVAEARVLRRLRLELAGLLD